MSSEDWRANVDGAADAAKVRDLDGAAGDDGLAGTSGYTAEAAHLMESLATYPASSGLGPEGDDEDDALERSTLSLFEGDEGRLSLEQRKALVALLRNRYISAVTHPTEWATLREAPLRIRSRLHDMFLDLEMDPTYEVAFKRQLTTDGGGRFASLLRDTAWGREDTVLMVFLRRKFQSERNSGSVHVFVDVEELLREVENYRSTQATNLTGEQGRTEKAVEALIKAQVLLKTNDPARLRVSPVLPVLMPIPVLKQLSVWLHEQTGTLPEPDGLDMPVESLAPASIDDPGTGNPGTGTPNSHGASTSGGSA